ncbi:hypothetical protein J6A31_08975 [bacterium]|nr:hypothetical protein [bacterium]
MAYFTDTIEIDGDVKVSFNPDTIMPDESRLTFEQTIKSGFLKKKTTTFRAVIKLNGDVLENENFTPSEIYSMQSYIDNNKVKFRSMIRELQSRSI